MPYSIYFPSDRRRGAPRFAPGTLIIKQNKTGNNSGALLLTKRRFTMAARPCAETIHLHFTASPCAGNCASVPADEALEPVTPPQGPAASRCARRAFRSSPHQRGSTAGTQPISKSIGSHSAARGLIDDSSASICRLRSVRS